MHAIQTAHRQTLCFLTFSGLSDEASTKDWEKCTIPTFLFSQNLWHQELGEVFRQSSYSPAGFKTTERWGKKGEKGHSKGKWGRNDDKSDAQVYTWTHYRENNLQSMQKLVRMITQEHWQWKSRTEQEEVFFKTGRQQGELHKNRLNPVQVECLDLEVDKKQGKDSWDAWGVCRRAGDILGVAWTLQENPRGPYGV